jgi:hypothetical protein
MQDCSLERNIIGLPGQSNRDAGSGKMVRMASRGGLKYGEMAWGALFKKSCKITMQIKVTALYMRSIKLATPKDQA